VELLVRVVPLFFVLQFLWSYYRTCWSKGYKLDVWHISLGQMLVVIVLMQPFARSSLNVFALGPINVLHMQPFVTPAALISDLGYVFVLIGGGAWRVRLGVGLRRTSSALLNGPVRLSLMILSSRRLMLVMTAFTLALMLGVLTVYFRMAGFGFDLSGVEIQAPTLRPVAQLSGFLGMLMAGYLLERFLVTRERSMLVLALCVSGLLLFYGSRTVVLGAAMNAAVVYLVFLRKRLRLSIMAIAMFLVLLFSSLLGALRSGTYSFLSSLERLGVYIAYGNSFSDLRDFAVILSYWNHKYLYGVTYVAGFVSFVPRFLLPFRDKYAIGVVTATMAGFLPTEHPGLRVGTFGEAYLNFGLLGVAALGLLIGCLLRLLDMRVKQELRVNAKPTLLTYSYFMLTLISSFVSSSVVGSAIYSTLIFFGLCWLMIRVSRLLGFPLA
jgi:oligosaccharide repeat unit polymerase